MSKQLTPRINRLESNVIIDGAMEIWPEGTSRSIANNTSAYGAVLFQYNNISSGVTITNSRQSSVPSGTNLEFSNQVSKTAAGTLAAGTRQIMHYHIEGNDLKRIWNNEWSLIFWVKSSVASNRSVSLRNASSSHSYVQQYNIAAANTWELKAIRFPAMSTCPGTVNRDNALGAIVGWDIVTGSTYQTSSLDQWVAGNFSSGIGEDTTWLTGTTHDFSIAGAMILPGDWESLTAAGYNFVRATRNFQQEVAASQRYFNKTLSLDVAPTTPNGDVVNWIRERLLVGTSDGSLNLRYYFPVTMRAVPVATAYSPVTGATGVIRDQTAAVDRTASISVASIHHVQVTNSGVGYVTSNNYAVHIVADARF